MKIVSDLLAAVIFAWLDTLNYGSLTGLHMIEIASEMICEGRY